MQQSALMTVPGFCEWSHLSRSAVYDLIARGELQSIKIGRARRIPVAMAEEWLARQIAEAVEV